MRRAIVAVAALMVCGCNGPGGRVEPLDVRGCPSGDAVVHATDVIGKPPPNGYVIDPGRKQVLKGIAEQFKPTLGKSWRGYDAKVLVRKGKRNGAGNGEDGQPGWLQRRCGVRQRPRSSGDRDGNRRLSRLWPRQRSGCGACSAGRGCPDRCAGPLPRGQGRRRGAPSQGAGGRHRQPRRGRNRRGRTPSAASLVVLGSGPVS